MTLVSVELPRLLLAETRFSSSMALVAPLLLDLFARDDGDGQGALALDPLDVGARDFDALLGGGRRRCRDLRHRRQRCDAGRNACAQHLHERNGKLSHSRIHS